MSGNARRVAYDVLSGWLFTHAPVRPAFEAAAAKLGERRDRAFARELVLGSIRHHGTLRHLASVLSGRKPGAIERGVLAAVEIGLYQIVFLDTPIHAAVHETVEVVRQSRRKAFANAVLREASRAVAGRGEAEPGPDPRRAIPLRNGRFTRFDREVLADPATDLGRHLGEAFSQPPSTVERWLARLGPERCRAVLAAQNGVPPTFVRVNPLRATRDEVLAAYRAAGVDARPGTGDASIRLPAEHPVAADEAMRQGRVTVQDETAQTVAPLLGLEPGAAVFCLCAAPGGKATHAAELLRDRGLVWAQDLDAERLGQVTGHARRLGLSSIRVAAADSTRGAACLRTFDGAIVDAPCSNSGVQRRRVEARWRLPEYDFAEAARLQGALLDAALASLAPAGGVIVYATCSIEEEENQAVVRRFLERSPGVALDREVEILPAPDGGDGGYMARLVRR